MQDGATRKKSTLHGLRLFGRLRRRRSTRGYSPRPRWGRFDTCPCPHIAPADGPPFAIAGFQHVLPPSALETTIPQSTNAPQLANLLVSDA